MWFIISILLAVALLISLGVQHEQYKRIKEYEYANNYMHDYIRRYARHKHK